MAIESVVLFTSSQIGTLNATGAEFIVDRACNLIPVEREWVEVILLLKLLKFWCLELICKYSYYCDSVVVSMSSMSRR